MYREYFTRNVRTRLGECRCVEDNSLAEDAFSLTVNGAGRAEIRYGGARGKKYAEEALKSITNEEGTLIAHIEDFPSFALRGIVEGFYGTPYTWEQRRDVIDFLSSHRMNAYFYAPKDDAYHRDDWRTPYPDDILRQLAQLKEYADQKLVRLYFCLSPGKDFDYLLQSDYELLKQKFLQLSSVGITDFAILFDDISPSVPKERFASAAEAHAFVANYINREVGHEHPLLFCPTDYFQKGETPYRADIRRCLDKDIQVFWTGYNTVAEVISDEDCRAAKAAFGHDLVLWDNYPVNDFEPKKRVYMGAVCNRTKKLAATHAGYIANPSSLWESSKFALATMAEWAWNTEAYDEEAAFARAVKERVGDDPRAEFFIKLSRSSVLKKFPDLSSRFQEEDWEYLDGYYAQAEEAADYAKEHFPPLLKEELRDLIAYARLSCSLYRAIREGQPVQDILDKMKACSLVTDDDCLLSFVAERGLGEVCLQKKREVYWNVESVTKEEI